MATFVDDSVIKTRVASYFRESSAELPDRVDDVVPLANQSAYDEILGRLSARGFTAAQIASWDRRVEFNSDIGLFWSLVNLANLEASDLWVIKLDRREELDDVTIMASGVLLSPGSTSSGQFGAGRLSTTDDTFTRDTHW